MISEHSDTTNNHPAVVTIGTFDGVHIGHQKILKRVVESSQSKNLQSVVLTFFPHPRMVLQPNFDIKLLHTIEERKSLLLEYGINHIVVKEFTKDFANLSARDFVKSILVDELNAKHVIIGYDHRFGKGRAANINDLKGFGQEYGFTVEEISAQDIQDVAVSSTKIRQALLDGAIETANAYLGYFFFFSGMVIKGKEIGRTLNFPTANIYIEANYKLIPKTGVYVVKSIIADQTVFGMMNIGSNPTFEQNKQSIEVHYFDVDQNLYGQHLKVEVLHRLRDEQKFDSVEDLQVQLQKDKHNALNYLKDRHG